MASWVTLLTVLSPMNSITFKQAVCQQFDLKEDEYTGFVIRHSLFFRVRMVSPFVRFFYPDFLFNERRLIQKIAHALSMREIQEEVDFYQHKYVVNFIIKDALRFRLSGMRLMGLANKVFKSGSLPEGEEQGVRQPGGQEVVNP